MYSLNVAYIASVARAETAAMMRNTGASMFGRKQWWARFDPKLSGVVMYKMGHVADSPYCCSALVYSKLDLKLTLVEQLKNPGRLDICQATERTSEKRRIHSTIWLISPQVVVHHRFPVRNIYFIHSKIPIACVNKQVLQTTDQKTQHLS